MRIAILSDFHFGFAAGTEREEDSYSAVREAIKKTIEAKADIVLLAGDIFDTRSPNAETLANAMEILIKPLLSKSDVRLTKFIGKDREEVSDMALMGIPIVAIHGTHERRVKGLMNPIEALEKAGFLIHLHCNAAVFEKNSEKVCIYGMSGVPDQYAESVLSNWNPKPEASCFNIFMLHQSIKEFLYAPYTIELNRIPKGFDLYIEGHIHEARCTEYSGKPFLITGSLIPTQLKEESTKPKGFWLVDTKEEKDKPDVNAKEIIKRHEPLKIYWIELENQRAVYYKKFEKPDMERIESDIKELLKTAHKKKPILRLEIKDATATMLHDIETKFGDKFILSFKKEFIETGSIPAKTLEEHKLSVEELGKKILTENLEKSGLEPMSFENIFGLLAENKIESAMEILLKMAENETDQTDKKPIKKQKSILSYGQT